jgi:hypothetical protein
VGGGRSTSLHDVFHQPRPSWFAVGVSLTLLKKGKKKKTKMKRKERRKKKIKDGRRGREESRRATFRAKTALYASL